MDSTRLRDRCHYPCGVARCRHVVVVDHHTHASTDIRADEHLIEKVGSATTVLVERLQALAEAGDERAKLSETEATLCALGIRTDTGALSFPATTTRDAYAYAWLLGQGCSQVRERSDTTRTQPHSLSKR